MLLLMCFHDRFLSFFVSNRCFLRTFYRISILLFLIFVFGCSHAPLNDGDDFFRIHSLHLHIVFFPLAHWFFEQIKFFGRFFFTFWSQNFLHFILWLFELQSVEFIQSNCNNNLIGQCHYIYQRVVRLVCWRKKILLSFYFHRGVHVSIRVGYGVSIGQCGCKIQRCEQNWPKNFNNESVRWGGGGVKLSYIFFFPCFLLRY